ncbi:DUF3800 domain-containing protein [Pelagerythrobacter marensis]|uniref:DUF3800 domain-containing protein n=1 Tax=Pelagerythrobacter marensis TaxID=543877 RepID=A0ABZ2D9N9_9SPHN
MHIAFMDEFGHIGPFKARTDRQYNQSPVFGLAGYVMPHRQIRHFATFFLQLKSNVLARELRRNGRHPATWEKKGADLITTKNVTRYRHVREGILRLLNEMRKCDGKIIFYGREKYMKPEDGNSSGLYTTTLSHTIRSIDDFCCKRNSQFLMILDEHSDRLKLLESATKTMFSPQAPARCLLEPPFQVESHLYQTIQAADWIATLVGRLQAFAIEPDQYQDWEWADKYFGRAVNSLATHSRVWRPSELQKQMRHA